MAGKFLVNVTSPPNSENASDQGIPHIDNRYDAADCSAVVTISSQLSSSSTLVVLRIHWYCNIEGCGMLGTRTGDPRLSWKVPEAADLTLQVLVDLKLRHLPAST